MTPRPRRLLPVAAATVVLSALGCSSTGADSAPDDEGATAVALVTAWAEAVRAGDAETACELVTPAFADVMVGEAMSFGARPTRACERAVPTLAEVEFAPPPVTGYAVELATADSIVLVLRFEEREPQLVTLLSSDRGWLVDGVKDAPEPT